MGFAKIKFISVEKNPRWQDQLKDTNKGDEGDVPFINAQWDAYMAKYKPRAIFEVSVAYRPVIIKKFR